MDEAGETSHPPANGSPLAQIEEEIKEGKRTQIEKKQKVNARLAQAERMLGCVTNPEKRRGLQEQYHKLLNGLEVPVRAGTADDQEAISRIDDFISGVIPYISKSETDRRAEALHGDVL